MLAAAQYCCSQAPGEIHDSSFYFTSRQGPPESVQLPVNGRFEWNKDRRFNFGLTQNSFCYIVLKVQADSTMNGYSLSIDNTSLDAVLIFRIAATGKQQVYAGGNAIKYDKESAFVWHTVPLKIRREAELYLIALKATAKNVNVQYKILPTKALQKLELDFERTLCFYGGIVSLILVVSLLGFFILNNSVLFLYACYILAISIWLLSHYGYLFPLFYPTAPELNEAVKPLSTLAATLSFLCLIKALSGDVFEKSFFKRGLVLLKYLCICSMLAACLFPFVPFSAGLHTFYNVTWHLILISSFSFSFVSILAAGRKPGPVSSLFIIAFGPLLLMAFFQVVSNAGLINNAFLNNHGILIGILFQILLFSAGITRNLLREKRQNEVQLHNLQDEQKNMLVKLISVQNEERKRIAGDLHDSIGPMLASIKINFRRAFHLKDRGTLNEALLTSTEAIIDDSITEIRNISHQLMPKGLSSKGLIATLSEYFEDLRAIYNIPVHFTHSIDSLPGQEQQLNLYRIISELILNAFKHSNARMITVNIATCIKEVEIMIADDGRGFDPTLVDTASLGLKNVEDRVRYLNGKIELCSLNGGGTQINIRIPRKDA